MTRSLQEPNSVVPRSDGSVFANSVFITILWNRTTMITKQALYIHTYTYIYICSHCYFCVCMYKCNLWVHASLSHISHFHSVDQNSFQLFIFSSLLLPSQTLRNLTSSILNILTYLPNFSQIETILAFIFVVFSHHICVWCLCLSTLLMRELPQSVCGTPWTSVSP